VRPGTVGQLVPGYEAQIADTGELLVEGDTAALMYFNEHAKTKQTFAGDLVHTGDLLTRDEDGFFTYRGRVDDLLKVGGIWVAPAEVEHALVTHARVRECAVVGYEQDGLTLPRAFVVLRDGDGSGGLAAELQDHVKSTLSPHKYPRDVRFVPELPRTGSGKVDRRALRSAS
jgi:acyl-coenzyme A synthetase/AMP-(fatty) acid ligase